MQEFQVLKHDIEEGRVFETATAVGDRGLSGGTVRAKIDRFAFTANNVTYAIAGDVLGYWQFFPPTDADGWGMMPIWGFAEIIESNNSDLPVGERLFGFFPPATHLDMAPKEISAARFVDAAKHRSELPQGYNTYYRVAAEPGYDPANDSERMLIWPLHITSFCLWDALQDNDWYGAAQIVIVSASSKTSIGLAYALDDDATAPPVIGITSARNLGFVKGLDLYQQCVDYKALADIDAKVPTVIVDMAGNGDVMGKLHSQLGGNMARCINVGLTHWDEREAGDDIITERSEFFFAPSHIQRRMQEWGPDGFAEKTSTFMQRTALKSRDWLKIKTVDGLRGLADIYPDVCNGRLAADQGLIVQL